MARYSGYVKTAAALDTAALAIVPAAAVSGCLRRLTVGITTSTAVVPTSQQVTLGINRGTARGTATTTLTPQKLRPGSPAAAITGYDTAWSVAPTFAAADMFRLSFNTQGSADIPWEALEEYWTDIGTANPLIVVLRDLALPAGHSLSLTLEHEE